MLTYRFVQKTKVLAQRHGIQLLPELFKEAGFQKPFLVFDQGIAQTNIIQKITVCLDNHGISYAVYDQITPDPTADLVDNGAKLFKENHCDCIVAIGGGSTMDAAKGINVMCHNEGKILDFVGHEDRMNPSSALICIPTTSGTGSELSNWIVITDLEKMEKHPINVVNSMCEYAVLDPYLTVGLPPQITAATGLDVFSHAFEAYTSTSSNIATDLICEKIMETVVKWLPIAVNDGQNIEARERMQVVASYGGWMLVDGVVHIGHCIAHEIGAAFHIPHGASCAYAFPAMLKHIAYACPEKIRYTGELLGASFHGDETPDVIAQKTEQAYLYFRDEVLKLRPLSEYHPDLSKVNLSMANTIWSDPLTSMTPVPVALEDVMYLLYTIFVE
jgi:alcohol dehydrogenase class IV